MITEIQTQTISLSLSLSQTLTFFALGAAVVSSLLSSASSFPLLSTSSEHASDGSFMNSSATSNFEPTTPFIC